ncbi:metallophosphoesterase family protein [Akkermansiaceae bacterium]|nr:metallophosphoesterase family protein [Akkermansiaceae bacterium]
MQRILFFLSLLPAIAMAEFSRRPYIQMATENSMKLVWRTNGSMDAKVKFGLAPDKLNQEVAADQILKRLHPDQQKKDALHASVPPEAKQFEASFTGLTPDTTYYYAILDGDELLTEADETYRFKTHPIAGTTAPVLFWVVGDSGTGGREQAQVHDAMRDHLNAIDRELDLYLHVGDMAYGSGTNKEFNDRFFAMYEPTLRNTVCWASMGNHEGKTSKGEHGTGPFYDAYICPTEAEAGGLPSGKEAYYSFDYGKVHFICLDSHDLDRRPSGAMAQWLKADLEKTKAEFVVAFFHHPPYTKGSHDSDKEAQLIEMREHIMPILESGGVDIFFNGHSHIYERSMLIDGAYHTPTIAEGVILDDGDGDPAGDGAYRKSAGLNPHNGTIAVVAGHGGTGVRRKGTIPLMKRIIVENGSCLISVEGDTLTAEMINLHGDIRDTFAITKSGIVEHTPIENPWQPEPFTPVVEKKKQTSPKIATALIAKNAEWSYLAGSHPEGEWTAADYDVSQWEKGTAGFGYGDKDDVTILDDMRGKYSVVYIRREFDLPKGANRQKLGINMSYDDAFIAYLNGKEVLRVGVDNKQGSAAAGFTLHEANGKFDYFTLRGIGKLLKPGKNVLSIEGHNANAESSDFTLHPVLLLGK